MILARVFKSGNTARVSMPRSIRHALQIQIGDILILDHIEPGGVMIRNLTQDTDRAPKARRKS